MSKTLFEYYQLIGKSLLLNETEIWFYPYGNLDYLSDFQSNISFVPTEVIESYRDDLIDSSVKENSLCIPVSYKFYLLRGLFLFGIFISIAFGVYLGANGIRFGMATTMALFMTTPFIGIFMLCPTDKISRRMKFAHLISNEIYRRRGGDAQINIKSVLWKKLNKNILGEVSTRIVH